MLNDDQVIDADELERVARARIEDDPEDADGWFFLGCALGMQDRRGDAIEPLRKCCELDPGHTKARANLGMCYYDMRLYAEAIEHLMLANAADPSLSKPYEYLARCYMLIEPPQPYDAIRILDEGLKTEGAREHVELWELRAELMDDHGFAVNERPFYDEAVEHFPDSPTILMYAGACYAECGDLEAARGAFDQAIAVSPADYNLHMNYARMLADAEEFDGAAPLIEKAERLYSRALLQDEDMVTTPYIQITKAYIFVNLNRLDEAKTAVGKAKAIQVAATERFGKLGYDGVNMTPEGMSSVTATIDTLSAKIEDLIQRRESGDEPLPWQDPDQGDEGFVFA